MTLPVAALRALRAAVGREHVCIDESERTNAERATFRTTQRVLAIVRPTHRAQVQAAIRVAARWRVPVYPISSGKNWGYGSRVPSASAVLLDLSRMCRIVDYDESLAYVTVEPGVTFGALARFLADRKSELAAPSVGSTPDASLIGNAMDRGLPWDAGFADTCGLEVVLATGECIRTGFSWFAGAASAKVYAPGIGPSLDGLFFQSNFGVVTQMTFWLKPRATHRDAISFALVDDRALGHALDVLRPLYQRGVLTRPTLVSSAIREYASRLPFPRDVVGDRRAVPREFLRALREQADVEKWTAMTALHAASRDHLAADRKLLRAALAGASERLRFGTYRAPGEQGNLAVAYWRKRGPRPPVLDPDRDRCGILFATSVVPFVGAHAVRALSIVQRVLRRYHFDLIATVRTLSARAIALLVHLVFDRDESGADERAVACHHAVLAALAVRGYYPYRVAAPLADALPSVRSGDDCAFRRRLGDAVDPAGILAPGRYDVAATATSASGRITRVRPRGR